MGNTYDPWGTTLRRSQSMATTIIKSPNPYTPNTGAGPNPAATGVIAWSLGSRSEHGQRHATNFTSSDDVISWQ